MMKQAIQTLANTTGSNGADYARKIYHEPFTISDLYISLHFIADICGQNHPATHFINTHREHGILKTRSGAPLATCDRGLIKLAASVANIYATCLTGETQRTQVSA
jgi:hypothetical protein